MKQLQSGKFMEFVAFKQLQTDHKVQLRAAERIKSQEPYVYRHYSLPPLPPTPGKREMDYASALSARLGRMMSHALQRCGLSSNKGKK